MAMLTILLGLILTFLGIGGYGYALATDSASMTALIPAVFGLPIALLGVLALAKPAKRMLVMHIAVLLALVGFAGAGRGLLSLPKFITDADSIERPMAVIVQSVMAVLCLVYLVLAIRSFIAARRAPKTS